MQSPTAQSSKPKNPRLNANPLSVLFFTHMLPVFWRNFQNGLKEEDLFEVLEGHKSSTLGDQLEHLWYITHTKYQKYALHLVLWKMFYMDILITGLLQGVKEVGVIIIMPYAVGQLVSYFGSGADTITKTKAYIYASIIVACLFIDRIIAHWVWMWIKHMSMKMRVGCCSLVYRKSLRLSLKALHQTGIGHIVNLLSNDVSKIDNGFVLCHYLWTAPLQAAVATYILYGTIGNSAFTGMVFIVLFVPLQIYLGKRNSMVRLKTALRTDERVRLMNEILSGIQIIKMYTWEKPFAKLVALIRKFEMNSIRLHFYIESFTFSLEMFVTRTSIFLTIITYLALGNRINADVVYSVTAIYNVIRPVVTISFSLAVTFLGEVHISILRLEEFLSYEETTTLSNTSKNDAKYISLSNGVEKKPHNEPSIVLKNVSVKWTAELPNNTLSDLNLCINEGQLVAVIGPVGSGKSSLLNVILNEVPFTSGEINVKGRLSYASQENWLFMGTVRQNILFGDPYDETRYKTVINVCALESDLKMLPYGDSTLVREKGKSLSGGQKARISLARCVYKKADIYLLDDPLSAVDTKVGKQLYEDCIKKFLNGKLCILITHQLQYLQTADTIIILNEGVISAQGTYSELQKISFEFASLLTANRDSEGKNDNSLVSNKGMDNFTSEEFADMNDEKETVVTGTLGTLIYLKYFKKGGNWFMILCVVLVLIAAHVVASGGDFFVSYWINLEEESSLRNSNDTLVDRSSVITTYLGITIGTIILGIAHSTIFFLFLIKASKEMHNSIFEKIVQGTMQFFNYNPTGKILNRFSRDIGTVDEYIPVLLIDVIDFAFVLVATIIVSCIVNIWFIIPCAGLILVLYLIRYVFIQTSRQVKRIEGIARTPIYSHAAASINGLTTIRANKAQEVLINEYDNIQDNHNSAWYLYISASEAFGLWIDLACIAFTAIIIYSFLIIDKGYYGGDVGLIITLYIALAGILEWGIFQWSELENNMTSVERILEYDEIETEPKRPPITNLPTAWPAHGKVIFENISMKYEPNGTHTLKNLNFIINPGEKIGIVGRTGAGKTSTISALFQFYPLNGSIIIDDVDITKLPLELVRSKIAIIPQECILFSSTMRKNLDPFDEYNDADLWKALEQVEIKRIIEELPNGLNTAISENGANFSIGQKQLICLARAIIRNNKIIIMDEATANIDSYTDTLIQQTIRKNFVKCTIITIAHRLDTIMDSDKVLVMHQGEVIEFDIPYVLLRNETGIFYSMVQTTGKASAEHLYSLAEEYYKTKFDKTQLELKMPMN